MLVSEPAVLLFQWMQFNSKLMKTYLIEITSYTMRIVSQSPETAGI